MEKVKGQRSKVKGFLLFNFLTFLLLTLFCLSLAQTIPEPPPNPINFLFRALEREAGKNLRGEVLERQLFPPRAVPEQTRADLPAPPFSPVWIRKNFRAKASFGEQIAGRDTWRIDLEPNNSSHPSFRFWIDQKWNIRIAVQERDPSGEITFDARFLSFNGDPKPRANPRQLPLIEAKPKLEQFVNRETGLQLPDGFTVFDLRPRTVGKDNLAALEVRASNGISVLVMVFAPIGTGNTPRIVSRNIGGSFIWVIGNLNRPELEQTAKSVKAPLDLGVLLSSFQNLR